LKKKKGERGGAEQQSIRHRQLWVGEVKGIRTLNLENQQSRRKGNKKKMLLAFCAVAPAIRGVLKKGEVINLGGNAKTFLRCKKERRPKGLPVADGPKVLGVNFVKNSPRRSGRKSNLQGEPSDKKLVDHRQQANVDKAPREGFDRVGGGVGK